MNYGVVWVVYIVVGVDYNSGYYIIFFNVVVWNCFFYCDFDDVINVCIVVVGVIQYFDVLYLMGVVVIGDFEYCFGLNYCLFFLIFVLQVVIVILVRFCWFVLLCLLVFRFYVWIMGGIF